MAATMRRFSRNRHRRRRRRRRRRPRSGRGPPAAAAVRRRMGSTTVRAVAAGAVVALLHQRMVHRLVVLGEVVDEEVRGVALRLAEVAILAHARKVDVEWGGGGGGGGRGGVGGGGGGGGGGGKERTRSTTWGRSSRRRGAASTRTIRLGLAARVLYEEKNGNKGLCVDRDKGKGSGGFYILCRFVLAMVEKVQRLMVRCDDCESVVIVRRGEGKKERALILYCVSYRFKYIPHSYRHID